ncbi:MAG: hypothetical protein IK020_02910 [Clostridiales bacterium]|nr:hypothetical protein [Clostridiales bacterium]MBR5974113.1 hypothetical protein [Clostridiales bacterium]
MFNLIKMNLYRMTRAVSTWVLVIVIAAFGMLQFGTLKLMMDDPFNMFDGAGTSLIGTETMTGTDTVSTFLQNSNILIIVSIFIVIFANAEQKSGFDKNIIGITKHRWKHTLARWISAVIGMTALLIIGYFVMFALCALFLNSFTIGSVTAILRSAGLMYIGMIAFSGLFFFFTTLFKSSAGGIVASLIVSLGILNLIEMLLDLLTKKFISNPRFVPSDFCLDNVVMSFKHASAGTKTILGFVALCLVYLVLTIGGSMLLQQRRDVK